MLMGMLGQELKMGVVRRGMVVMEMDILSGGIHSVVLDPGTLGRKCQNMATCPAVAQRSAFIRDRIGRAKGLDRFRSIRAMIRMLSVNTMRTDVIVITGATTNAWNAVI